MSIVKNISIYPIKSAAGIDLSVSWVDNFGLSFDRRFVLSDPSGSFITARTDPTLCLIQVHLMPDGIVLNAPNMPALKVIYSAFSNDYQSVTVWGDKINAQHCLAQYDMWFSQYLERPCQLLFFGENSQRKVDKFSNSVAFADGYPLLLISQASLDDLNEKANMNMTMKRFRPNIVVDDTDAFEEDTWEHIRIGEVEFELVKPCSRCIFTTVEPLTGQFHHQKEPLKTLANYRQVESGDVMFGQNLVPLNQGSIKQGDSVEVISYKDAPAFINKAKKAPQAKKRENPKQKFEAVKKEASAATTKQNVSIDFKSWNKTYQADNQLSILEHGEASGLILPYSCRAGMCGRCKVKLESGEVRQLASDGLTDAEKDQGFILACSCIPQSDVVVSKP